MSVAWFSSLLRLFKERNKSYPIVMIVSNFSFGIYLVHIGVMRNFLWNLNPIKEISNYYVQTGVIFLLTFAISLGICYLISIFPWGQYIIGTKMKR